MKGINGMKQNNRKQNNRKQNNKKLNNKLNNNNLKQENIDLKSRENKDNNMQIEDKELDKTVEDRFQLYSREGFIVEDNTIYEIDEDCLECLKKKRKELNK